MELKSLKLLLEKTVCRCVVREGTPLTRRTCRPDPRPEPDPVSLMSPEMDPCKQRSGPQGAAASAPGAAKLTSNYRPIKLGRGDEGNRDGSGSVRSLLLIRKDGLPSFSQPPPGQHARTGTSARTELLIPFFCVSCCGHAQKHCSSLLRFSRKQALFSPIK